MPRSGRDRGLDSGGGAASARTLARGIVLGAPRSGTTFLMGFLGALPDTECVSGNLLPVGIAHIAAQGLAPELGEVLQRSFRGSLTDYLESGSYLSRNAALRKWWVASRRPDTLRSALRAQRRESMLVYKEPFLAFAPEYAYEAIPDARLVYIFRDGRDVADSLVRSYDILSDRKLANLEANEVVIGRRVGDRYVPWWVSAGEEEEFLRVSPYARALWMWREMVSRCDAFWRRPEVLSGGRVLQVRYEALVSEPVSQGEAILEHLGRELTPRMKRRLEGAHARSVGIHGRRAGGELREGERIAAAQLASLGYALERADVPLPASP